MTHNCPFYTWGTFHLNLLLLIPIFQMVDPSIALLKPYVRSNEVIFKALIGNKSESSFLSFPFARFAKNT